MHRTLERGDEPRAHGDALGAQREGRRHAAPVDDPARRHDRHVDLFPHSLQQREGVDLLGVADAGTLCALDDQPVHPGIDRLLRPAQGRGGVIDGDARGFQQLGVARRITCRGRHEVDPLAEQPVDDRLLLGRVHLQVADRQVDAERLVGRGADRGELALRHREVADRILQQAHRARLGHRRDERSAGDPGHRRLEDGVARTGVRRDSIAVEHGHGPSTPAAAALTPHVCIPR
jgi:hypothetical protein